MSDWLRIFKPSILSTLLVVLISMASEQAQSQSGESLYAENCAQCHSLDLRGSAHGSKLKGAAFIEKWSQANFQDLLAYNMKNMPPGNAGALNATQHRAILAYLVAQNGIKPSVMADADQEWVNWSEAGSIEDAARNQGGWENNTIANYRPISETLLQNPPDDDWLSWRRTLNGHGYSPLAQINPTNVRKLKLAWSLAMNDGSNQGTPLVNNGIMFLTHAGNMIQAIEANTGSVIWEYKYEFPPEAKTLGGPTRNIALYQDKVFLTTYDAAIVAIDATTGKQVWRAQKADFKDAYTHTAGPIIAGGVVVSGINGCELYKKGGCFVTGHDPETGRELWRRPTIALQGTPGGDSWGGLPDEQRAGGDNWIAGSYDPATGLYFMGTSQAKPWVAASRGMSTEDAALYTNSTLAIDPKNGEIVWYHQHIPGETIDMEVGFERVLVDIDKNQYVVTVGKDGILWRLNRATGDFSAYVETLPQNIFEAIDTKTGAVRYRADIRAAQKGDKINACPGIYGGHNWQASAYFPPSQSLIIPLHDLCSEMIGRDVDTNIGGGGYGGNSQTFARPGNGGLLGHLAAYNVATMAELWRHKQRAMFLTGALTTGGGLVFIGDLDRKFQAFDAETGKAVWQTRLPAPLHGYPISYAVNGRQYVAVQTGIGVFRALTAIVAPEIYQPSNGQAIYVFELDN